MGVALIGWGRFSSPDGNITVPAPPTDPDKPWLWDFLASQASDLRQIGFTALQLPPASKAQGGAGVGCDGYGVFDPRDIGSKNQQGSMPTRYGDAEQLRRLVAVAHANDMQIYLDLVLHQRIGANAGPGMYRYLGADGKTLNGRGPMNPQCFRGGVAEDDVPNVFYDFSFGDEVSYQHCVPARYTIDDALDWGDWIFRTTGADGGRFDDVKGTWAPFVHEFMTTGAMADKLFWSEYFDGAGPITAWADDAPMNGRSLVADFPTHFAIAAACNDGDAWALQSGGIAMSNGPAAVTFVDNPDTDTSAGQQVIGAKLLGYAFLLTSPGYPFVFGKDYFGSDVWPGAYGLKKWIDTLVGIHENLAFGPCETVFCDGKMIVMERTGYPGLLTALNFDTWNRRTVTVPTSFGPGVDLHDYTGRHADIQTAEDGSATFEIPSNAYDDGQSYLCFSRVGYWSAPTVESRSTTQTFFGAADLDIGPVPDNGVLRIARIWAAGGSSISIKLTVDKSGWTKNTVLEGQVVDDFEAVRAYCHLSQTAPGEGYGRVELTGWHTLIVRSTDLPVDALPFEFEITYTAPKEMP